jgi:dimethylamine/trimethylamine dehydrogenase
MARDPRYDVLFEPVSIGPKTLRNRFYATSQCSGFGSDRPAINAYHRAMKAEGGYAITHTEWSAIHPEADEWPATTGRIWDDDDARNWRLMCTKVHEHGALAGIQLGFNGKHTFNFEGRLCARGVTQVPSDTFWAHSCYEMTREEILELEEFYVAAARRAEEAGFDVIQIGAMENACVPQQFLMPLHNKRRDEYGGAIENRARFLYEVTEKVRAAVGERCAVSIRLCIDTLHGSAEGIRVEEDAVPVVRMLDNLVDLWDFQVGGRTMAEWGDDAGASRFFKEGHELQYVAKVRPHTKKPVANVGRFVHPDEMVKAIESGVIDLIGNARPGIADPFLPNKIAAGRTADIRECIGCNICVSRYEQHASIICTQNATIGEEYRRGWHPERFSRARNADNDVLIVGAGPAGMECARVLGERGLRRIHLVDEHPEMGGHLNWVSKLPGLGEWAWVVDYRKVQLDKLKNVEFIPKTHLDAAAIRDYGAEIVIVANGSDWVADGLGNVHDEPLPGTKDHPTYVLTPEQIMVEGREVPGERVLIYDTEGYFMGPSLAEKLAREGKQVTFVTSYSEVGPYMFYTLEGVRMNRLLHSLGVELVTHHVLSGIAPGTVSGERIYAEGQPLSWAADAVVLCTMRASRAALYRQLEADRPALRSEGVEALYRIGDCVVPRVVAECVFDGHRLAREIDEANPAVPLPFIRERRVLGKLDRDYDAVVGERGINHTVSSAIPGT